MSSRAFSHLTRRRSFTSTGKGQERCLAVSALGGKSDRSHSSSSPDVNALKRREIIERARAVEVQRCAEKSWKSAIVCLGNMRKGGVAPGLAAYNVALQACASAGELGRAEALVQDMKASGTTPDQASFDALIAAADTAAMSGDRGVAGSSDVVLDSVTKGVTCAESDESPSWGVGRSEYGRPQAAASSFPGRFPGSEEPSWSGVSRLDASGSALSERGFSTSTATAAHESLLYETQNRGYSDFRDWMNNPDNKLNFELNSNAHVDSNKDARDWSKSGNSSSSSSSISYADHSVGRFTEDWGSAAGPMEEQWGCD